MRKVIFDALAVCVIAATTGSLPAAAHHSHAMFDLNKEQTITGTVRSFVFTNPHVYLYVDAPYDNSTATYVVEMSHVQNMMMRHIKAETFKPGDKVTVVMNPLRNGKAGGNYVNITDGKGTKYD
jgi:hypothetical protein